ncbi:MAG: serine hydrolase domain-containing protein [bacterium]
MPVLRFGQGDKYLHLRPSRQTASTWLYVLAFALCAASANGQTEDQRSARLVNAMASELRVSAHLPGLSVAIARGGQILIAQGLGYADIARTVRVTPATQFRTASVGKVITATALATLVQRGALNLDSPVQAYVPAFPVKQWTVTSRELAGHLAGMPHYNAADKTEPRFYASVNDALGVFAAESLLFEPGSRYSYSTHGFTLLSAVIEGASGKPFLDYLTDAVLQPLGMKSTGPHLIAAPTATMTTLYAITNGTATPVEHPEDPSYKWAGGGMISTPSDLVRLASGYLNGFLKPETVAMMFASQRLASGKETGVGIAWRNGMDVEGHRAIEHAGSMEGTRTVVSMFPESKVVVAIMANAEWSSMIEETAHMLAVPYLTRRAPIRQPDGTAAVTVTVLKRDGTAERAQGTLTLRAGAGTLTVDAGSTARTSYALVYLERGNTYALVRPDGIVHLTLETAGDSVSGKAIAYGSPRMTSPADNPPFLTLGGVFSRK